MTNEYKIGKAIKDSRLSQNLTMDYVASKANITRATLWSVEKGNSNCSIQTLLNVMDVLGLSFSLTNNVLSDTKRTRATRINTVKDKKINRFIVMCIEQYAKRVHQGGSAIYKKMLDRGLIKEFEEDYEDLHGMSTLYLNNYIGSLLKRRK